MQLVVPVSAARRLALDDERPPPRWLDKLGVPRSEIPAVTHVDHSARVQTVDGERNRRFHRLLDSFRRRTGCPVLINTSFNVRGEPIVCTPEEAYRCFMATNIDVLVLEDFILVKEEQAEVGGDESAHNVGVLAPD